MAAQPNMDQLEALVQQQADQIAQREAEIERLKQLLQAKADAIQQQADQIAQREAEIERLKQLLQAKADAKAAKPPTFPENYSLARNPRARRKKKRQSPGRTPHAVKRELAAHAVAIYPPGVSPISAKLLCLPEIQ